jgi:hypothetical protein
MSPGSYLLLAAIGGCAMTALAARMVFSRARRYQLLQQRARRLSARCAERARFLAGREQLADQSEAAVRAATAAINARLRDVAGLPFDLAAALEPAPGPATAIRKIHKGHTDRARGAITAFNRGVAAALRRELSGTKEPPSARDRGSTRRNRGRA